VRASSAIPSLLTMVGLVLRLGALVGSMAPVWGLLGIACDVADGASARRLGATTDFGRELDWHADCACAGVALAILTSRANYEPAAFVLLSAMLVPAWAYFHATGRRVSFSSPLVVLALATRPAM